MAKNKAKTKPKTRVKSITAPRTTTFRFRFSPATLAVTGMSNADLRACVLEAGRLWSRAANVAIVEAPAGQPTSWYIRAIPRPGVWGTYSGITITISTWKSNVTYWMSLNAVQRRQFFTSLLYHETWHGMGGHGNTTPAAMRAWLAKRYGPPVAKKAGVVPRLKKLPVLDADTAVRSAD